MSIPSVRRARFLFNYLTSSDIKPHVHLADMGQLTARFFLVTFDGRLEECAVGASRHCQANGGRTVARDGACGSLIWEFGGGIEGSIGDTAGWPSPK